MRRFLVIMNSNFLLLFLIPVVLSLFLFLNKPAYEQQHPNSYDLQVLPLVLQYVGRYYVDEQKIDPNKMLLMGLNRMENSLDEVLVEFDDKEDSSNFTIQVNDSIKEYNNLEIYELDDVRDVIQDVLTFVVPILKNDDVETIDIEYAVTDNMLKVLDEHSGIITPEIYKEFMIETEGSFGGLGIVIGIRDGDLTVISPIEGTPAHTAGIKPNDKIVQIENESTINMSLIEAVGKLRGKKGTSVNIWVMRNSFSEPRQFHITRDTINIESVEDFSIDDDILYLRIRDFQKNTLQSMVNAIEDRDGNIDGLILDLRGNPGGLLDQAEKISDLFLKTGTVVTTKVGNSKKKFNARFKPPEFEGEVVVLVDSGSASASEIVAGALKNNDRAIIIGDRTFGKGSVQQIFDLKNGSALKLTIAHYLTPGEISIQDIGITPDIQLQPTVISKDKVVFSLPEESNNSLHNNHQNPVYVLKYLDKFAELDEEEPTPEEALSKDEKKKRLKEDFYVLLAKEIINSSTDIRRNSVLNETGEVIAKITEDEENRIESKWREIGIDWDKGDSNTNAKPQLKVTVFPKQRDFEAGKKESVTISIRNLGENPIYRLMAITESDNPVFDGQELIFGKLLPGQTRKWTLNFDLPKWSVTRNDKINLKFYHSGTTEIPNYSFKVSSIGMDKPLYAYNFEVIDDGRFDSSGNGDGKPQTDETISLAFNIKNIGDGASEKTIVTLKNLSGEKIFLEKGRVEFENFQPDTVNVAPFLLKINDNTKNVELDFHIFDVVFRDVLSRKIKLSDINTENKFRKPSSKYATIANKRARILGGGYKDAPVIGYGNKNATYKVLGYSSNFVKVKFADNHIGWLDKNNVVFSDLNTDTKDLAKLEKVFYSPPIINILNTPLVTSDNEITLSGSVEDVDNIESVSVFNGEDKVKLLTPHKNAHSFSFKLRLESGVNIFNIIAKDSEGLFSKQTLTVRKDDLT